MEDALSGFPAGIHLGEAVGVARNSAGEIFVYTRTGNPSITLGTSCYVSHGGSRLFKFDARARGRFQREIGQETYGALYAQQVRVDPPDNLDVGGEIYKMRLDRTLIGRFGPAGKLIRQFGTVNAIDCREENQLLVGELGNWRAQRVTLE